MNEPKSPVNLSGWTIDTYAAHNEALRAAEEKFQTERDRRYAEVKNAEEKALKVKEEADKAALGLAREIQTYKDEKANELREQIGSERGLYATKNDVHAAVEKIEAQLNPVLNYVASNQGIGVGALASRNTIIAILTILVGLIAVGSFVFVTLRAPQATPQVIYVPAPAGTTIPVTPQSVPR